MSEEIKKCRTCGIEPDYAEIASIHYLKCRKCGTIEMAMKKQLVYENWNLRNTPNGNYKIERPSTIPRGPYAKKINV